MLLTREIRFVLGAEENAPHLNTWAGAPLSESLGAFLRVRATICGSPDPTTGFFCNVQEIDAWLRQDAVNAINRLLKESLAAKTEQSEWAGSTGIRPTGAVACQVMWEQLQRGQRAAALRRIELLTSDYLRFARDSDSTMIKVTQQFEFSASHRLFCHDLSDEQNWELFGKCSSRNGHGHNYRLDVTLQGDPDQVTGEVYPLAEFQRVVQQAVIDRFDHTHLNLDQPEFAQLNPTVENIAKVIWDQLVEHFTQRLAAVRVYETPKTWAEYSGA